MTDIIKHTMKIKIKVTKEILEESKMCDSSYGKNCAIAKAIIQILPNSWVSTNELMVYESRFTKKILTTIFLPFGASHFIRQFDVLSPDERAQMPPIDFEIDVPESVIETIGLSEVHRILKDSKTLELA